jgi:hypothetical protein
MKFLVSKRASEFPSFIFVRVIYIAWLKTLSLWIENHVIKLTAKTEKKSML